MPSSVNLDTTLLHSIATQMLIKRTVNVLGKSLPVAQTSAQRLRFVTFKMDGRKYQAVERNPEKPSQWGKLAREGHQVVQFKDVQAGKFLAVSVDGEVKEYGRRKASKKSL